ncbi:MAG: FtsQ-type POTRA domain-containing protein [Clostridia bacterium]|nr:FtsQ-type POTRA domain-containing protein [Clostridia bacterium]
MKIVRKKKKEKLARNEFISDELEQKKRRLMKEKRKQRRKRRVIVFVFLFVCIGIIVAVLKAPFFNIQAVYSVGQSQMSESEILEIAQVKTGVNIFSTNLKIVQKRLSANAEIEESSVRRIFPNKIKISVKEAKPIAYIKNEDKLLFIDKWGKIIKVLTEDDEEKPAAPELCGIQAVSDVPGEQFAASGDARAEVLFGCIPVLSETGLLDKLNYISLADLSDIQLDYENRLYMMLGSYENIDYKLKFVKKVIDENISEYEKALLDYRGDKLYVGRRETPEEKALIEEAKLAEEEKNEADENDESGQNENEEKTAE